MAPRPLTVGVMGGLLDPVLTLQALQAQPRPSYAVLVTLPSKSRERDTPGTHNLFTFLQVLSSSPSCLVKNGSNLKKKKKVNWRHVGSEIHQRDHSGFTLNRSLAAAFQQELCGT